MVVVARSGGVDHALLSYMVRSGACDCLRSSDGTSQPVAAVKRCGCRCRGSAASCRPVIGARPNLVVVLSLLEPLLFGQASTCSTLAPRVVCARSRRLSHVLPALVACWSHCICVTHLAVQPICPSALSTHIKAVLPLRAAAGAPLSMWSERGLAGWLGATEALSLGEETSALRGLCRTKARAAVVRSRSWRRELLLRSDEAFAGDPVVLVSLHFAFEPARTRELTRWCGGGLWARTIRVVSAGTRVAGLCHLEARRG